MKRCVIIGAADIANYKKIKEFLSSDDFYIFCDGGIKHQKALDVKPDLIVGDFDSADFASIDFESFKAYSRAEAESKPEIIKLPCEKDDTDVFFAVKEAVRRGFEDFLLLGVIGQRFDHSLCNLSVLLYLYENKKSALLVDDYSEMQVIGSESLKNPATISDAYSYFSLMCPFGDVSGVSIKNAKYPLENAEIKCSYQFGISNEVLNKKTAFVSVKSGLLLLIKIW